MPAKGERSDIELLERYRCVMLIALSIPVRSAIRGAADNDRNDSILCDVIESPGARSNSLRNTAAKWASGTDTTWGGGIIEATSIGKRGRVKFPCTSITERVTAVSFGSKAVVTNSTVLCVPVNRLQATTCKS